MKRTVILPPIRKTNRRRAGVLWCGVALLTVLTASASLDARPLHPDQKRSADKFRYMAKSADAAPIFETRLHSVGQVWWALTNYGLFGTEGGNPVPDKDKAPLKITYSPSFEFPAGTQNEYLYAGGLWIGGIIGTDTLVSLPINGGSNSGVGEFASYDTVSESSSLRASPYFDPNALADQQFYAKFSDTLLLVGGTDELDGRRHLPLHIEVSQTSYAWSDRFSRQFVIVECWIKNIGTRAIDKLAVGIFLDADVLNENTSAEGFTDDLSGFLSGAPDLNLPQFRDSLNVTWVADNDGDPVGGTFPLFSPRGAVGMRILHSFPVRRFSFNWWLIGGSSAQEWGPTKEGSRAPASGGGLGIPEGDRNRYFMMTNGEIDYGQLFAAEDFTSQGWRPPIRSGACGIADGLDTRQLASVGPAIDPLYPGDSVPFVYAMIGGNNFHTDPKHIFDCADPYSYANTLGFSDLAFAATWASWIYDTPGFDSDGDGYKGEFHLANCDSVNGFGVAFGCDTVYYTGDLGPPPGPGPDKETLPTIVDGGADIAGPAGPSCPQRGSEFSIETRPTEIIVRWSGRSTEPIADPLSKKRDFEGYRLYTSRINSSDRFTLYASWDISDYKRYIYNPEPPGDWVLEGDPIGVDSLRVLYGDATTDSILAGFYRKPSQSTCFKESFYDDDGFLTERCSYFEPQEDNRGNQYEENGLTVINKIQKVGDSTVFDELTQTEITFGYYEAHITDLNPSLGQYISITAFDYGNAALNLDPLESAPGTPSCTDFAIPIYSAKTVQDSGLKVIVYPNPYKISYEGADGRRTTYFEEGFEAPEKRGSGQGIIEQDRRIWFVNLPSKATIRIYTLDGDLVRTIDHEDPATAATKPFLSDYSSRAAWDLVSRNTQAVVSGIYIYRVDSELGSQVGKLVIIK